MSSSGPYRDPGGTWMMMHPPPDCCQLCAHKHDPSWPHNAQLLHYQYRFYFAHGRWPTWADAVAHCDSAVKAHWEQVLRACNAWTEPPAGVAPIAEPCAQPTTEVTS